MKRISYNEFGGPEVLHLAEVEEPHPAPHQIRISVRAAGVNPVDWRIREGSFRIAQTAEHGATQFPAGCGQDASGSVDEIGRDVRGVALGDNVFGRGFNTYAEFAVLFAWAPIPQGLTFDEAAGYPSVVETAIRVINEVGVQRGQTLLVSGASGGVGSAVLQVARDRGIAVIGIAGAANLDYLRSLGAAATTYDDGWVERVRQLGTVDAALDLSGSGVIPQLVALTGDPQKVITTGDMRPPLGVRFSGVGGSMPDALAEATRLISAGKLHIPIEKSYPLGEAAAAHTDSRAGHTRGRRVIII